ncbi:lipase [Ochrobactrum sp. BTU1]|uniref:lipase n=1 Tax=Ochrobactrum sp. BTU1 TaxID=2840456 RepID=UPI0040455A2E
MRNHLRFSTRPLNRRYILAAGLTLFAAPTSLVQAATNSRRSSLQSDASIHLLRGFANIFSRGLDQIATDLRSAGIEAIVHNHSAWRSVAATIIADYKSGQKRSVVLIGHSLGANAIISISEELAENGIRVDLLASFAATAPAPIPRNVKHAINYYFSENGWGLPLVAGPRFKGKLENRDYSRAKDIGHFNIDKQRALQVEVERQIMLIVKRRT